MSDLDAPSPFVARWIPRLTSGDLRRRSALDVACGRGRHVPLLSDAGLVVFGVDNNFDALKTASRRVPALRAWCADLTMFPLPREAFDVVIVTRYLQRDLFDALARALVPGGFVVYETFTTAQIALGWGPKSPDHLLQPGELRSRFAVFDVIHDEEVTEPEAVARLVGRKPARSG